MICWLPSLTLGQTSDTLLWPVCSELPLCNRSSTLSPLFRAPGSTSLCPALPFLHSFLQTFLLPPFWFEVPLLCSSRCYTLFLRSTQVTCRSHGRNSNELPLICALAGEVFFFARFDKQLMRLSADGNSFAK